jgi:hypothetical protein
MLSRYSASTVCFTHSSGRVLHQQVCFAPAGVFCTSRCVLHQRGVLHKRTFYAFFRACFAPTVCFTFCPGVFCTGGVFCTSVLFTHFSGRVLHRRCVLHFFRASFAQAGAFCGSPGIFVAVCAFYAFSRGVPHSRGVSRHGVFCPRACDTAQACAPCRCVTHTRGIWR